MKKILKVRWITTLLLVVGVVVFFSFKSGDSRSFQIAKNLDIFNSIVKELDMFNVDTLDRIRQYERVSMRCCILWTLIQNFIRKRIGVSWNKCLRLLMEV